MSTTTIPLNVRLAASGLSGLVATAPMSAFMHLADGAPVQSNASDLPPRQIVEETAQSAEPLTGPPEMLLQPATLVAHYGYGTVVGMLYAIGNREFSRASLARGVVFGLEVWLLSYLGLLPAIGSRARATNQSLRTNVIMILAHVVWGATLGLATAAMLSGSERRDNHFSSRNSFPLPDDT